MRAFLAIVLLSFTTFSKAQVTGVPGQPGLGTITLVNSNAAPEILPSEPTEPENIPAPVVVPPTNNEDRITDYLRILREELPDILSILGQLGGQFSVDGHNNEVTSTVGGFQHVTIEGRKPEVFYGTPNTN